MDEAGESDLGAGDREGDADGGADTERRRRRGVASALGAAGVAGGGALVEGVAPPVAGGAAGAAAGHLVGAGGAPAGAGIGTLVGQSGTAGGPGAHLGAATDTAIASHKPSDARADGAHLAPDGRAAKHDPRRLSRKVVAAGAVAGVVAAVAVIGAIAGRDGGDDAVTIEVGEAGPDGATPDPGPTRAGAATTTAVGDPATAGGPTTTTASPAPTSAPSVGPAAADAGAADPGAGPLPSAGPTPTAPPSGPGPTVPPGDTTPPAISALSRVHAELDEDGFEFCARPKTTAVSAVVSDASGIAQVTVTWTGGSTAMARSGSTWSATIGPLPDTRPYGQATQLAWSVTATDVHGNVASAVGPAITVHGC